MDDTIDDTYSNFVLYIATKPHFLIFASFQLQTWGQLLLNVMHYITITFKIIALHYDYNYRGFDNVMHYITITSQSNALHYNYLKGLRTLFIYIMKCHDIQTIPSKTLKHPWPSAKTTIFVNQRLWLLRSFGLDSKWRPSLCMTIAVGGK